MHGIGVEERAHGCACLASGPGRVDGGRNRRPVFRLTAGWGLAVGSKGMVHDQWSQG